MNSRQVLKKTISGTAALSLGSAVNILGQFATVPVALTFWGKARYGEWVVLTGLVVFLKIADLGLQTYVINRLCTAFELGDKITFRRLLKSALAIQAAVATFVLSIVTLALWSPMPVQQWLGLTGIPHGEFVGALWFITLELMIFVPMGIISGLYRATGLLPRAAIIGAIQQFLLLFGSLLFISLHSSFTLVAAVRVFIVLAVSTYVIWDLTRIHGWIQISHAKVNWSEGALLLGPGLLFLLLPLADYFSNQVILLVVNHLQGAAEVSRFSTHRTLINGSQMIAGIITFAIWPQLTALHAKAEHRLLRHAHRSLVKLNLCVVGMGLLATLLVVTWVYPAWTLHRLELDGWVVGFLSIRMIFWAVWNSSATLLSSTNRHQFLGLCLFGSGLCATIFCVILVPLFGIAGAALSGLIGDLALSFWIIPRIAARTTEDPFRELFLDINKFLLVAVLLPYLLVLSVWFSQAAILAKMAVYCFAAGWFLRYSWKGLAPSERGAVKHLLITAARKAQLLKRKLWILFAVQS